MIKFQKNVTKVTKNWGIIFKNLGKSIFCSKSRFWARFHFKLKSSIFDKNANFFSSESWDVILCCHLVQVSRTQFPDTIRSFKRAKQKSKIIFGHHHRKSCAFKAGLGRNEKCPQKWPYLGVKLGQNGQNREFLNILRKVVSLWTKIGLKTLYTILEESFRQNLVRFGCFDTDYLSPEGVQKVVNKGIW